jgi:hypothetical protein
LTDEEADEKERREDERNAGCAMWGLGCCLPELFLTAGALGGLMFLSVQLLR